MTVHKLGKLSENQYTEEVQAIRKWFIINKLTVNTEKNTSRKFCNAEAVDQAAFVEIFSAKASFKYLGILLDNLK